METYNAFVTMKIVDFIEIYFGISKSDLITTIDNIQFLTTSSMTNLFEKMGLESVFKTVYDEFLTYAFMPISKIISMLNKCYVPPTTPPPTVDIFGNVDKDVVLILKNIFDDKDPLYIANVASDPKVYLLASYLDFSRTKLNQLLHYY